MGWERIKKWFFYQWKVYYWLEWKECKRFIWSSIPIKVGDIIYLKSNRPGSRDIRVKGIGFVTKSFIQCLQDGEYGNKDISDWNSFFIKIKWISQIEFKIEIPTDEGRLTNIRAATFYEEYLPYVQNKILETIIK